jgi:hypothetical protein
MVTKANEKSRKESELQYHIVPQTDSFTVRIIYPQNSIHRVGGFKTEDDAQAWIGEARQAGESSRWFD